MKKWIEMWRLVALLMALALFTACGGDSTDEEPIDPPVKTELTASQSSFSFEAKGGSAQISVISPASWSIKSSATWCYTSPNSGVKGTQTVQVMADVNTGAERTATLTLTASGCDPVTLTVKQAAAASDGSLVVAQPDTWDNVTRGGTIYQILVYSFADSDGDGMGDFNGIRSKLDYIASLGVTALWLSPIHPADSYHGYDVRDYTAINPAFGTMGDFENLVKAAHEKGIKIYLDYVVNHSGKGHKWFVDALEKREASPYWNYYNLSYNPAADIAAGKFPMISSYNSGDWFTPDGIEEPKQETHRYKFTIATSNGKPSTITVSESSEAAQSDNTDTSVNMFLWYGETGAAHRMYYKGNGIYELVCDFNSPWGFLVRTSNTSWDGGRKWGGDGSYLELDKAYKLNNSSASDIQFEYMRSLKIFAPIFGLWMPELNYGNISQMTQSGPYKEIIASVKGWLDKGVDGLRLDAAKHIYGVWDVDSRDFTFWKTFHTELNNYYKTLPQADGDFFMVAEIYGGTDQVAQFAQCLPSAFNFDFLGEEASGWNGILLSNLKSQSGRNIAQQVLNNQKKLHNRNAKFVDALKLSNHDQDRSASQLGNVNLSRMAGAIMLTLSGRPVVYYGEELGFTGRKSGGDIHIRQPMKWSDTEYAKYTGAILPSYDNLKSVAELDKDPESLLNVYRQFGQLRNIYPAMTEKGTLTPCYNTSSYPDALSAFYRELNGQKMLVMHNVSDQPIEVKINETVKKAVAVIGKVQREEKTIKMAGFSSVVWML
ncbi:MAG: alpha-amylase [Alistipes sp.]|nr:alpha-amylase [Alistipes sp.]